MDYADDLKDPGLYLLDAFLPPADGFFLIVTDDSAAAQAFALQLHRDGIAGSLAPGADGMFALSPDKLLGLTREGIAALLTEARGGGAWVVFEEVHQYVRYPEVLRAIFASFEESGGPVVLATTTLDGWHRIQFDAPRLVAVGTIVLFDEGRSVICNGLLTPSTDPDDTGWTVIVKLVLSGPLSEGELRPDPASERALTLVSDIHMVDSDPYPSGVLIRFGAETLLSSQLDTALRQAEIVAARIVGRPLGDDESIQALRGVYYM